MKKKEKELIEFLEWLMNTYVDKYGHLDVCRFGDKLDPTIERVVKEYLRKKEENKKRLESKDLPF